jgi:2-C-methyl-D-erythritol 4-phosphate cytidylyltransferase
VGGRPLYAWSLDALLAAPSVDSVVIAGPPGLDAPPGVVVVPGGPERSQSVRNALRASDGDPVVVQDAARPMLSADLVERCVATVAGDADAAVAAAPVTDTTKEASPDGVVLRTLDRSSLWAVQTPQVFRRAALEAALSQPDPVLASATDDAQLVEAAGGVVRVVEAPRENLKVTTPLDLRVAELLLGER